MKYELPQEKLPIFKLEIDKSETRFISAQDLVNHFKQLIDEHKITRFIGEFDHYSHTRGLDNDVIANGIEEKRSCSTPQ